MHTVWTDINHSFMEVPAAVGGTCELLVFLFLTQITEEYLEVVMTVGEGRRGQYSLCQG